MTAPMAAVKASPGRAILRGLGRAGLAVLLALLVALLALRVAARTDWVTARLLAYALPRLQVVLAGRLTVGSIEGDLLGTFVIHDAAITAADGRPAIAARRLQGRLALAALLHGEVRLVGLRGEGVWFGMHLMPDGRFNLAGLAAATVGPDPPPAPGPHPIRFSIVDAHLVGRLRYDAPTMPLALRELDAAVQVEAGLEIASGLIRIPLAHVEGTLLPPLSAPVRAQGVLVITDDVLTLEGVGAVLALDEVALHRLLPDDLLGGLAPLIDRLGPALLTLGIEGGVTPVAIQAQADFPRTPASVVGVVTLDGEGPRWSATGTARRARLSSSGRLDWDWLGEYQGHLEAPDLAELAVYGGPAVEGPVRATAKVVRRAGGSELGLDLDGGSLRYGALRAEHLTAHAATGLRRGTAQLSARGLHLGPLALATLTVEAQDDGAALTITARGRGPAAAAAASSLAPTSIDLTVRGAPLVAAGRRAEDAFARATLDGQVTIGGQAWRTLTSARLELDHGLRVADLALAAGPARLTGSGGYRTPSGAIEAQLVADHLDPAPLLALVAPGVRWPAAELHAELRAGGTTRAPRLEVDASAGVLPDEAAFPGGRATIAARYRAGRVGGEVEVTLPGQRLRGSLAAPLPGRGGPLVGHLVLDADLGLMPPGARALGPIAGGQLTASVDVAGTWAAPRLALTVAGHRLAGDLLGRRIDGVEVSASGAVDPASARAEARLAVRGADLLALRGRASLPAGGLRAVLAGWRQVVVEATGEVPGYPLALLPELAPHLVGRLEGTLTLRGRLGGPSGTAALRVADLRMGEVVLHGVEAHAELDGAGIEARLAAVAGIGTLDLRGRLPWSAAAPWTIDLQAVELPLDLSGLPLSVVHGVRGTLDASLQVEGTRAEPRIGGFARAHQVVLTLWDGAVVNDQGELDVSASDGQVALRRLAFRSATGSLEVHGAGRIEGLRPVALDGVATLVKLPVAARGVSGWLSAIVDLQVLATNSGYGGEIIVRDGLLRLADLSRVRSVQSTARPEGVRYVDEAGRKAEEAARVAEARTAERLAQAERAEADPGLAPDRTLAIRLVAPFRVEGEALQATLAGQVGIDRLASRARVTGGIATSSGWLELLGRRYQIEHLSVDFDGSPVPDPRLDLRLTRTIDVTIVIEVDGHASAPDLTFSSIPPVYTQEQIMAMILSGSPSATEPGPESQATRVAGALSASVAGMLKDQLLPVLPVDVIKVDLARRSSGEEDTRFEVGKYLGDSFYLSYVHQLGAVFGLRRLNRNQLQLDYRFARQFQVGASFGDEGVGALDLSWVKRY